MRQLSDQFGLAVDPDAVIEDVSVGQQQRVEILRALYRDANILVLDEPTAVLTAQETQDLFKVLRALRDDGKAIVFITHKLGEVLDIADRVTVLRRGKRIDTVPTEGRARPRSPASWSGATCSCASTRRRSTAASRSSRSATSTSATTATCRPSRAST